MFPLSLLIHPVVWVDSEFGGTDEVLEMQVTLGHNLVVFTVIEI
jgi:hypothetical protein